VIALPPWVVKAGVTLALLLGAWLHGYHHGGVRQKRLAAAAIQAATAAVRNEETRRVMRLQEAQDAEHLARQAAQRDTAAARAASDGLRQRAADLAALSCGVAATPGGASAPDGPRVLADVLGELAARADRLAEEADAARIAGQLCERAYDALTGR
jgi:hypothetical protein